MRPSDGPRGWDTHSTDYPWLSTRRPVNSAVSKRLSVSTRREASESGRPIGRNPAARIMPRTEERPYLAQHRAGTHVLQVPWRGERGERGEREEGCLPSASGCDARIPREKGEKPEGGWEDARIESGAGFPPQGVRKGLPRGYRRLLPSESDARSRFPFSWGSLATDTQGDASWRPCARTKGWTRHPRVRNIVPEITASLWG